MTAPTLPGAVCSAPFPSGYVSRRATLSSRERIGPVKAVIRILKQIHGCHVRAADGDVGKVTDCYFDEASWTVRYFVVELSSGNQRSLVEPDSIEIFDADSRTLHLKLDSTAVERRPSPEMIRTVSKQYEVEYYRNYSYLTSWMGPQFGSGTSPGGGTTAQASVESSGTRLRSAVEVGGYHIQATDREIGHLVDLLADSASWQISGAIIDTSKLPWGKLVLLKPEAIKSIEVDQRKIIVQATSQEVHDGPEYS
jgi:hypothetical protein